MGKYNPDIHHRRSIRLRGYDYSQAGFYFVTICCQNREHLFGEIDNGKMALNDAGEMINNEWLKLTERFENIKLHEHVIMPNHFHAILEIAAVGATLVVAQNDNTVAQNKNTKHDNGHNGQPQGIAPTETMNKTVKKTLGDMVGAFQSITTVNYINGVKTKNWKSFDKKLWQQNYWEHIIRNENEFIKISEYIRNNPIKWHKDKLNGGEGNFVMESSTPYNEENWMV